MKQTNRKKINNFHKLIYDNLKILYIEANAASYIF